MLSRDDYFDFQFGIQDILDECFIGVDLDSIPDNAHFLCRGYTDLTKNKAYHFTDEATHYKKQLIGICQNLPIYPPINKNFCGTIAYGDLLPDDMSSQGELLDACEIADEFFALLELNDMGIAYEAFKNKYGFKLFLVDPRLSDQIKPNRSAFVEE